MKFFPVLIFSVVVCARAEINPPVATTNSVVVTPAFINALADEARTNNPALRAAELRVEAGRANEQSIRKWEDPTVRFGVMSAEKAMRADEGDLLTDVEQKLPVFGKPQAARRVAESATRVEEATAEFQFQQLRKEIAQAVFKMAVAGRVIELEQQDLAWTETMVAAAERRYETGEMSQVDVLRLQNERSKRATSLKTDSFLLEHEQVNLARLLNRRTHFAWPALQLPSLAGPIAYSEKLVKLALHSEPKLKMMQQQIRQAEASVEQTRRQRFPDFRVGAEVRQFSETQELRQSMLTVSFNFPWGNSKKYAADVKREQAKMNAAELDAADYELSIRNDMHQLVTRIDAARREALLYRDEIIPRSEMALESARAAWETSRGMFRDVMDARRMLVEAQVIYARAIGEQYQMMSELVLCCGLGDLESLQAFGFIPETETPGKN
jgi:cobalt-zinc-cadmium efflux system outer membrane protein